MRQLNIFWGDSKGKVIIALCAFWLIALSHLHGAIFIWQPMLAVVGSVLLDLVVQRIYGYTLRFSLSSVISGLIIGLVGNPNFGPLPTLVAVFLAILSKHVLRKTAHVHIFNPAVFGLLMSSIIFRIPVGWWVVSWGSVSGLVVAICMFGVLRPLRSVQLVMCFIFFYWIGNIWILGFDNARRLLVDGTMLFFSFVMLPEPVTSLVGKKWSVGFSSLVGLLVFLLGLIPVYRGDPLLTALLLGNAVGFFWIRAKKY